MSLDNHYFRRTDGPGWVVSVRRGTVFVIRRTRREARESLKLVAKGSPEADIASAILALEKAERVEESL